MDKCKFVRGQRDRRRKRIRKKISGDAERPRLLVYRSLRHIYAQVLDDDAGVTLVSASTKQDGPKLTEEIKSGGNVAAAVKLGEIVARKAMDTGIRQVRFDRGGYQYHGRVKALAEAARKAGLVF